MTMTEYLKKYPWLRTENLWTGQVEENYCALQALPEGWVEAFGEMMCKELDQAIKAANLESDFYILQAKEKWGFLHLYISHNTDEINDIIRKYERLSSNICICCGKPDVSMLNLSWISPICENCYNEHISDTRPYSEVVDEDNRMPDVVRYRQYSKEFDPPGWKDFEIDISETAEKIRKRWEERTNKR